MVIAKYWTCNGMRSSPPGLMSVIYSRTGSAAAEMTVSVWPGHWHSPDLATVWLFGSWTEKHGTKARHSWRKLHIGMDAATGEIVAAALTTNDVDDACQIGPLLDQMVGPVASFTGDGAYDQDSVYGAVIDRDPNAAVIVPPRSTAVASLTAEKGRMGWQKASGYNTRSRVEAAIGRYKHVIGDGLRSRKDGRRAVEVGVAVNVLNQMLELGRPNSARIAWIPLGWGLLQPTRRSMQQRHARSKTIVPRS
jgi:hypothetical protein